MRFLRLPEVIERTGLPRSTIYDQMSKERFPKPVKIASRAVAWIESEILDWQEANIRVRQQNDE